MAKAIAKLIVREGLRKDGLIRSITSVSGGVYRNCRLVNDVRIDDEILVVECAEETIYINMNHIVSMRF